jgi:hypothetical protein
VAASPGALCATRALASLSSISSSRNLAYMRSHAGCDRSIEILSRIYTRRQLQLRARVVSDISLSIDLDPEESNAKFRS